MSTRRKGKRSGEKPPVLELPADVVASVVIIDMEGETMADIQITRAVRDALQNAAMRGIHGVGLGGVLSRVLDEAARRFEPLGVLDLGGSRKR